jgi:phenylphosphate carboxylase beta subunit
VDLREFIATCEAKGELRRIKKEVDWDLELVTISKLNEFKKGPALLFENVKGYKTPLLSAALCTERRLAIILGMPEDSSLYDMAREWVQLTQKAKIPPKVVSKGSVMENVIEGNKVDLLSFPVPKFFPLDGGRYIGTAHALISQHPDEGWTNVGTYRMQVLDKTHAGVQLLKGKHAELMLRRHRELGTPMPVSVVIGYEPMLFLFASTTAPWGICEYDLTGGVLGKPMEVIKSDFNGLMIPAHAEIVLEGEMNPDLASFREEGPFGEYTGYYSAAAGEEFPKPVFECKRILHRNNPIFWITTTGLPIADSHLSGALQVAASIWSDLRDMRIPGVQSVHVLPESGGRVTAIVSLKQMYPGHTTQVLTAIAGSTSGHYRLKIIIAVDEDIPPHDLSKVWWAISIRTDPERSVQIVRRTRGGPLDPGVYVENRDMGSKLLLDATIPFEWKKKPIVTHLDKDMVAKVEAQWKEYGLE